MYATTFDQSPIATTKIKIFWDKVFTPSMVVMISKDKKQPLHFDFGASLKQHGEFPWPQICQALKYHIQIMKALVIRQLIQCFQYGALRCG